MPIEGFGLDSFEDEVETVIARHNELLTGDKGEEEQAIAFAMALAIINGKMVEQRVAPAAEVRSGVAYISWDDQGVLTFVGDIANPDWLHGESVNVRKYRNIQIRGKDLGDIS